MPGIAALTILCLAIPTQSHSVVINEAQPSNTVTIADEDGDFSDWIELYNPSGAAVNLRGYTLSDDRAAPFRWTLPDVIVPAEGHLLLFASGKDRRVWAEYPDTIIRDGDVWRYHVGNSAPPDDWNTSDFDDGDWPSGASGFGYGYDHLATSIPLAPSIFIRAAFDVEDLNVVVYALVHIDYDDGFVAYLNGVEFSRANIGAPGWTPLWADFADVDHAAKLHLGLPPERFPVANPAALLRQGRNVLAIQIHNSDPNSENMAATPFFTIGYRARPADPRGVPEVLKASLPALHTNFRLDVGIEGLVLANQSREVIDSLQSVDMPADYSIGRQPDGSAEWYYFDRPTPGMPNDSEGRRGFVAEPRFSPNGGIYPTPTGLTLTTDTRGASIYYTRDGRTPSPQSTLYTTPIPLDSTTVIRAIAAAPEMFDSRTMTRGFIVNFATILPVVSLATDPWNFFDADSGIYVPGRNYNPNPPYEGANYWNDWERPIHIEFYEHDGTVGFRMNAGVQIFGGITRTFPQKSLAIFARAIYGENEIRNRIFPDLAINRFESIVLRNSGNDWYKTMFRDAVIQQLVKETGLDIQAYRPAVVFLNGQYWGIHNIREKLNEHYLNAHHDVDKDSIDNAEISNGSLTADQSYHDMLAYLEENDLNVDAVYDSVAKLIDMRNAAEYFAAEIYIDNYDWPGENYKAWRSGRGGERWRWFLFDTDFGFGLWEDDAYTHNTLELATDPDGDEWPNPPVSTFMLRKLLESPRFRADFINQFADFMNYNFHPVRVSDLIDRMMQGIEPEMPRHKARWDESAIDWYNQITRMHTFGEERPAHMRPIIEDYFSLPGSATLRIAVSPPGVGTVRIDERVPESYPWIGVYFMENPIPLTAIPTPGYKFVRWSGAGKPTDRAISITLNGYPNRSTAVFKSRSH